MEMLIIVTAVFWLAYSNGANDNFKGVATLYGSGTATFKTSITWATITTAAGSLISVITAYKLVELFSGKGIVPEVLIGTPQLIIAVASGSAVTILAATFIGMPTSTTHALTGSLLGVALIAASTSNVIWGTTLHSLVAPLLFSPFIAIILSFLFMKIGEGISTKFGISDNTCVCLENRPLPSLIAQTDSTSFAATTEAVKINIVIDQKEKCDEIFRENIVGIDMNKFQNAAHFLSSGAVCFSRAMNDTPKIAALLLVGQSGSTPWNLGLIASAMVIGGLLNARKVAETMSMRITEISAGEGISANFATATLVLFASKFGMPVSTTHVSCGSIFGIGLNNKKFQWGTVTNILVTWVTTIPFAAVISAIVFLLIRQKL